MQDTSDEKWVLMGELVLSPVHQWEGVNPHTQGQLSHDNFSAAIICKCNERVPFEVQLKLAAPGHSEVAGGSRKSAVGEASAARVD